MGIPFTVREAEIHHIDMDLPLRIPHRFDTKSCAWWQAFGLWSPDLRCIPHNVAATCEFHHFLIWTCLQHRTQSFHPPDYGAICPQPETTTKGNNDNPPPPPHDPILDAW